MFKFLSLSLLFLLYSTNHSAHNARIDSFELTHIDSSHILNNEVQFDNDSIDIENIVLFELNQKRKEFEVKKQNALISKNYKKAFEWYEKEVILINKIKDQSARIDKKKQLVESQIEQEVKDDQQKLLSKSKSLNFILIFFLALSLLSVFFWKKRGKLKLHQENQDIVQKNKKLNKELSDISNHNNKLRGKNELLIEKNKVQNKELLEFIAFKTKQNIKLERITADFDKFAKNKKVTPIDIKLMQSKVAQLQSDNSNNWLTFKQKIEDTFPNFFSNLTLKHPQLTEKDKFHCGYILIDLNIKTVAALTFVSETTVNSTRYRIKKKLNLPKTVKLKDYLKKIKS